MPPPFEDLPPMNHAETLEKNEHELNMLKTDMKNGYNERDAKIEMLA